MNVNIPDKKLLSGWVGGGGDGRPPLIPDPKTYRCYKSGGLQTLCIFLALVTVLLLSRRGGFEKILRKHRTQTHYTR